MAINRAELKSLAKEQIKGNVWTFFGLSLVLGIILSVSSFVVVLPKVNLDFFRKAYKVV